MSELNTDFSVSPYFDDYDEDKQFYRILFRPRTAVQARELTQLQTIIQNQISRFGTHVFKDGSVVDGVAVSYIPRFDFVHLENTFNGANLSVVSAIANTNYLITNSTDSNTAVRAVPVLAKDGFLTTYPETNRVYVKYITTGKDGVGADVKTFASGDTLFVYDSEQNKLGTLDSNNIIDSIDVITANATANAVGVGYGMSVSSGIIYQKGFFIRVEPQTITVKDFDTNTNDYLVGFDTTETTISAIQDQSLNDNAAGFPNFTAPGADRLKLTPNLISTTRAALAANSTFFPIVVFNDFEPTQENSDPVYNKLGEEFARRTFEESGNYFIKPFQIETLASANTSNITYEVSPGISYINGYRVEFIGSRRIDAPKATTTEVAQNQVVTANYGQYVDVQEYLGAFDIDSVFEVAIYDQAQQSITQYEGISASPSGSIVGYANVKTVIYGSGIKGKPDCRFLVYLFNIRMNSAKSFSNDAKSLVATSPRNVRCDLVLSSGRAILRDIERKSLVFNTGQNSVRRLTDGTGTNDTSYVYRQTSSATLQSNGFVTFTLNTPAPGATESLNFSVGTLSDQGENDFNIILSSNAFTANLSGSLVVTTGNTTIIGSNTAFTTELSPNDIIRIDLGGSTVNRRVVSITNDNEILVDTTIGSSNAAANYQQFFVDGSVLDLSGANNTITVISNTQFQIATDLTLDSGTQTVFGQYPVLRNIAVPTSKNVRKNRLVKINGSNNAANTVGPWNLGLTDVYNVKNVWVGSSYSNTNPDRLSWFVFDNGQRDDNYDHARLIIRPEYANNITSSSRILVNVDHFVANTSAGVGFFSVDSYPIDDANTANTLAIQTQDIPVFVSENGQAYDLRNAIDFRPVKFNTANSVATTDPANTFITENPAASNNSFTTAASGQYLAEVDSNFRADIEYYLPRIDLVTISSDGTLSINQGTPEVLPRTPFNESDSSIIARVFVPAFPTLSTREGEAAGRRDLATRVNLVGNRRYTMKDIGSLEQRIERLEYYTVLNALEQKARDLTIPDTNGLDRFKNGIFADPFNSHNIGKVGDFEYKIAIDPDAGVGRPFFGTNPVDFTYNASLSSGVVKNGNYITRPFTNVLHITQPYATKFRNATEVEWEWTGNLDLYPENDYYRDDRTAPNINVSLDLSTPWEQFANSPFGTNFGDWRTISAQTSTTERTATLAGQAGTEITQTNTTTQDRIINELNLNVLTRQQDFGTYVSDFSIQPFMRSRLVAFVATTLKPNTRIFAFFDDEPVSVHCAPGVLSGITDVAAGAEDRFVRRTDDFGTQLVTDSNGFVCGIFRIPDNTFRVGDRIFTLCDVDNLVTGANAIQSKATQIYSASSISVTRQTTTLTTREPQLIISSRTDTRTLVTSDSSFVPAPAPQQQDFGAGALGAAGALGGDGGDSDPFAQSIFIRVPTASTGMFVSQIGLFFRTKDPNLGCTVFLMEMRGGFPDRSMTLGKAYLPSSQINAPGGNTQQETVFTLENPVYVQKDKFYAFMIFPDGASPEYTFWLAELGGFDVVSGEQIFRNPYVGTAFISANQLSWTPIQEEDVKFNLYRAEFEIGSGTATFENESDEYIRVDGFTRANSSVGLSVGQVVYTVNATANTVLVANTDPFGIIQSINEGEGLIELDQSIGGFTANTQIRIYNVPEVGNTSFIVANNLVATATIEEVRDIAYHAIVPRFATLQPVLTNLEFEYKGSDSLGNKDGAFNKVQNNTETEFTDKERFAYSKSNETSKTSEYRSTLSTNSRFVSPVIDLSRKASLLIENIINNDATNEHTRYGNALTKYVSKNVILADGQEAEDLKIFMTAYRPVDTDIKVYVKFQNPEDSEPFDQKLWTEMEYLNDGQFVRSSPLDVNNYIEYEFGIPTTAAFTNSAFRNPSTGIVEYVNNAGSRFVSFKIYSIKIVLLSSNPVRVPRLNDARGIALQI
jgi:hypothetical protein